MRLQALVNDRLELGRVEDRVLGVEADVLALLDARAPPPVGRAHLLHVLQLDAHVLERLEREHGRQEAADRLLGAAVGVIEAVGQGVHHGADQAGGELHLQLRQLGPALLGHGEVHRLRGLRRLRLHRAGVGVLLRHAVHEHGERHAHGVGLFVRQRLDGDGGLALLDDPDAPVHAGLAAGGHLHVQLAGEPSISARFSAGTSRLTRAVFSDFR